MGKPYGLAVAPNPGHDVNAPHSGMTTPSHSRFRRDTIAPCPHPGPLNQAARADIGAAAWGSDLCGSGSRYE